MIGKFVLFGTKKTANGGFPVLDIVAVLSNQDDYDKTRNYCEISQSQAKEGTQ